MHIMDIFRAFEKSIKHRTFREPLYWVCFIWNPCDQFYPIVYPTCFWACVPQHFLYLITLSLTFWFDRRKQDMQRPVKIPRRSSKLTHSKPAHRNLTRLEWAARLLDACERPPCSLSKSHPPQPYHNAGKSSISDDRAAKGASIFSRKLQSGLCIVWAILKLYLVFKIHCA